MPTYTYKARNARGMEVQSAVDAATRYEALAAVRARGLTVVELQAEEGDVRPVVESKRKRRTLGGRVSLSDKVVFCRQLAVSVNAGVPLREALESIAEDVDNAVFAQSLDRVIRKLHDGQSFSEAISKETKTFSPLFVALVKAAEESGSLPQTLENMAESLERSARLARKVQSVLSYPVFVAVFFIIVCILMQLLVLPRFERVFADVDSGLPALTRTVFAANRFWIDHIVVFGAVLVAVVAAVCLYARTREGGIRMDRVRLRIPFFGDCMRKFSIARFCRNLSMMVKGGVPIATAIEISSETIGNRALAASLLSVRQRIMDGESISGSFAGDEQFPRLIVRMIAVGESSGRLPEVLDKVADLYEDQVEGAIMVATSLFEPIVICVFGVVILVLVLAIYVPIFTMASGGG